MDNSLDNQNSQPHEVKEGSYSPIRIRFDTALRLNKKQWFEVYSKLGFHKSYASQIRNGHIIPPPALRVKIAQEIGIDSSILWEAPDIISADKYQIKKEASKPSQAESPSYSETNGEEKT